jgi:hypothetical protein
MDGSPPTVEEFVEYCHLQAGLLAGTVETLTAEAEAMLDDVEADLREFREAVERAGEEVVEPTTPPVAETPGGADVDDGADRLDEREATLSERQALVEAKTTRARRYRDLARGYTDLGETLAAEVTTPAEAVERITAFEVEHDAPAYFDDRETLAESVAATTGDE